MSQKTISRFNKLLILASVLAAIKVLFVDYTMDEEYQIVMAYRNLAGDTFFGTMWEPHQTSAFVCVWLMRIFCAITKSTTGVVLFLRAVTCVIQVALSVWVTKSLEKILDKEYAFLFGCCYFNIVPKIIQIPEFSNLQLWFYTVIILALFAYYEQENDRKKRWLLLAGVGMALEVLAYPSSLLLFPFLLVCIFIRSGKGKQGLYDSFLFALVCGICAVAWLLRILSQVSLGEFLRNVPYIVSFDLTHDVSLGADYRKAALVQGIPTILLLLLIAGGLGGAATVLYYRIVSKNAGKQEGKQAFDVTVFAFFFIMAAQVVQVFYWVVLQRGYEEPQIHLLVMLLSAGLVWRKCDQRRWQLLPGILGGVITILAVIYMSDLGIWYAIPHGLLGALFALAVVVSALEKSRLRRKQLWVLILLFSFAFCSVFAKGFTLRAGTTDTNSVLGIRGVMKYGPTVGIFTGYMQSYIMNCTYEDFKANVEPGENCLIVTNMVAGAGTTPYLFDQLSVSHFSIVDPTSYDERLLTYWELYPEKQPDVIVVDCWYGQLQEAEDNWIMQYIENDFGYTHVADGRYVRFYCK